MHPLLSAVVSALALVVFTPLPSRADVPRLLLTQDPPVIPRALIKRQGEGPQRFVRTELFFGTATKNAVVTEEVSSRFLMRKCRRASRRVDAVQGPRPVYRAERRAGQGGSVRRHPPAPVRAVQGEHPEDRRDPAGLQTEVSAGPCCASTTSSASACRFDWRLVGEQPARRQSGRCWRDAVWRWPRRILTAREGGRDPRAGAPDARPRVFVAGS